MIDRLETETELTSSFRKRDSKFGKKLIIHHPLSPNPLQAVWPECWKTHEVCDKNWISAIDYLEIVGIIVGQIVVGVEADWIGRKFGMVQDALVMTLGSVMLTAMWGTSLNGWIICYAWW